MTSVRINYDRFVNSGFIPSTDFENSMMDVILDWADATLHPETKIALPDLIDLYWAVQFGEVQVEALIDDEEDEEEPMSAEILEFSEKS